MDRSIIVCICSLALSISSFAQAPTATAEQPKPGPEVQKLAYYLGTWKGEGETKGVRSGLPASSRARRPANGSPELFHLVCRGEERGPSGKRTFLNILAYDEKANAYTEYGISSLGESEYSTGGSIVGNKRAFVKNLGNNAEGKPIKVRYVEVQEESPTFYTYQAEASIGGGPWTVIAQGKITKVR